VISNLIGWTAMLFSLLLTALIAYSDGAFA
jgi:hypothetical protein